jgi:hypothetical protein
VNAGAHARATSRSAVAIASVTEDALNFRHVGREVAATSAATSKSL